MAIVSIMERTDIEHEVRDAQTNELLAVVTYHDKHLPRPFRLEFMSHVQGTSISYHASMDRVHEVANAVHEHMI